MVAWQFSIILINIWSFRKLQARFCEILKWRLKGLCVDFTKLVHMVQDIGHLCVVQMGMSLFFDMRPKDYLDIKYVHSKLKE